MKNIVQVKMEDENKQNKRRWWIYIFIGVLIMGIMFGINGSELDFNSKSYSTSVYAFDFPSLSKNDSLLTNDKFTYDNKIDNIKIRMIPLMNISLLKYNYNFTAKINSIEPYFEITIPNDIIGKNLHGRIFDIAYEIDYGFDVSNTFYEYLVPLKTENLYYKQQYYCYFINDEEEEIINGEVIQKSLISKNEAKYVVRYNLTDININSEGIEVIKPLTIKQGTKIKCTDPIISINPATNFDGMIFWANNSQLWTFYRMWNYSNAGFNGVGGTGKNIGNTGSNFATFIKSDYSQISDIGLLCYTTSNSQVSTQVINTTTGFVMQRFNLTTNTGTSSEPSCNVMFWKNTTEAILVYEDTNIDNTNFLMRNLSLDGTLDSATTTINYNNSQGGWGQAFNYNIKQRPNITTNETMISFRIEIGATPVNYDGIGAVLWNKDKGAISNFTSGNETRINGSIANHQDFAWTDDGKYGILASSQSANNFSLWVYNRTNTNFGTWSFFTVDSSQVGGSGVYFEDFRMETLPNRNDAVALLTQTSLSHLVSAIVYINGTVEANAPTPDTSVERDVGELNTNIGIYPSETNVTLNGIRGTNNPNGFGQNAVGGGGQCTWGTVNDASTSNDAYADCLMGISATTSQFNITSFNFSIPAGATIRGIMAEIEVRSTDAIMGTTENSIQLLKANTSVGNNKAVNTLGTLDTYYTHGSSTDLWGTTWTPADINNAGFGIGLRYTNNDDTNSQTVLIDHVRMTVYYNLTDKHVIFTYVDLNALGVDTFAYSPVWRSYMLNNIGTQSDASTNFASDDIETFELKNCPFGNCFMLSTVDALNDIYSGIFWDGDSIDISKSTLLAGDGTYNGRKQFTFLFRGNQTAPVSAPPTDTCTYSSGDWNVDCADNCRITNVNDLGGNDLIISGTGSFDVLSGGKIKNYGEVKIDGTSSANQCTLNLYGTAELIEG